MSWVNSQNLLTVQFKPEVISQPLKLASFDLDSTIVETKSGNKFAKDEKDWKYCKDVKARLLSDAENGFTLVIFTNQGWSDEKKIEQFKRRMEYIAQDLNVSLIVYSAVRKNSKFRKPLPEMYRSFKETFGQVDLQNSFYVGDAAGRPMDHDDTDRTFAKNIGLQFYTPEEYFQGKPTEKFKLKLNLDTLQRETLQFPVKSKELLLLVGQPGSGKSTFVEKHLSPIGYLSISQDNLKTKQKCLKTVEDLLKKGSPKIVVDNTNPSRKSRAEFIEIAKKYTIPVRIAVLTTPNELCQHNNAYRAYMKIKERIPEIAYRIYNKNYEAPSLDEGCDEVIKIPFVLDNDIPNEYLRYYV